MKIIFFVLMMLIQVPILLAQVTGLVEDFDDNLLTGWEVPSTQAPTYQLEESDSILKITYNRTASSWEWDNFNFTPPLIVNATGNPYISVKAKSNVRTQLTFKPIYQNGQNDWLQVLLPNDSLWHSYVFELAALPPYEINRIYMYLDGGTTIPKSGMVYFDDLRLGDSVRVQDMIDLALLEKSIRDANLLLENSVEGLDEGEFEPGSKAELSAAVLVAQSVMLDSILTVGKLDTAVWDMYDACMTFETRVNATNLGLLDSLATKETRYLYINLDQLADQFVMFGMHDATGYGVGWSGDDDRSDVKDVCGSYPAVYSEDMNKITENSEVDRVRYRLTSAYDRGGIITMCWHQYDPLNRGFYSSAVNYENIVATLLPGGQYHDFYRGELRKVASFLKSLRGNKGESIPVIFRPYHEHTGDWFWWGAGQCTITQYNQIWQFTVTYLQEDLNVHNLIYAISPSSSHINQKNDYFTIYPGDDYIDIFGLDHYFGSTITGADEYEYLQDLQDCSLAAIERSKVLALTEVGQENLPTLNFFTRYLLDFIKTDSLTNKVAYAAVWRNESVTHHFAPYPGHPTVPNFLIFYNDPYTIFEDNLPDVYILSSMDTLPPILSSYPLQPFVVFDTLVTIEIVSDERAFLRYSYNDQPYQQMPYEFELGQGTQNHSTTVSGEQGEEIQLFIRAADYYGNVMSQSVEISFTIDTLSRPVHWSDPIYNISAWDSGAAPFEFTGGTGGGTIIPLVRTAYFRHEFPVANSDSVNQLVVFLRYDNGAVIYLNGIEVHRIKMPEVDVTYHTWANPNTTTFATITLDANDCQNLRDGTNIIGVEVHQAVDDSLDLLFDLKMIDPATIVDYGATWHYFVEGTEPEIQTLGSLPISHRYLNLPVEFELRQNYPNPFNPTTTISWQLAVSSWVQLSIYDISGREVEVLVNEKKLAGLHQIEFKASNLASGIYLYRLQAGNFVQCRKMIVLK